MKKVDLKCVMLGKANVGKSCLVERFSHNKFSPDIGPTVGAAFVAKDVQINKQKLTIGVWDTAGSERYASMTRHYYQGAEAAVVCYDMTDLGSWNKVKFWVGEILSASEDCILSIVGTKSDLLVKNGGTFQSVVDPSVVKQYAQTIQARSTECSAKTGQNVEKIFHEVCQAFYDKGGTCKQRGVASPHVSLTSRPDTQESPCAC